MQEDLKCEGRDLSGKLDRLDFHCRLLQYKSDMEIQLFFYHGNLALFIFFDIADLAEV